MAKKKSTKNTKKGFDILLFILCLIPFGLDKLYMGNTKMFLIKCLLHFIGIGFIWWIFDIICCLIGTYKVNPLK